MNLILMRHGENVKDGPGKGDLTQGGKQFAKRLAVVLASYNIERIVLSAESEGMLGPVECPRVVQTVQALAPKNIPTKSASLHRVNSWYDHTQRDDSYILVVYRTMDFDELCEIKGMDKNADMEYHRIIILTDQEASTSGWPKFNTRTVIETGIPGRKAH